jgi:ABC-type polysaccharide/polyol phosphate transport system ATPase subunit
MLGPATEMEGLTEDYAVGFWLAKQRRSLDNLTMQVETGEVFGLLGRDGKTELHPKSPLAAEERAPASPH